MELKDFKFDNSRMLAEVRSSAFKQQKSFANEVMKNHKSYHYVELVEVDNFSDAYDSSKEVLYVMLAGFFLRNKNKLLKHGMHLKLTSSFRKTDTGYLLYLEYRP